MPKKGRQPRVPRPKSVDPVVKTPSQVSATVPAPPPSESATSTVSDEPIIPPRGRPRGRPPGSKNLKPRNPNLAYQRKQKLQQPLIRPQPVQASPFTHPVPSFKFDIQKEESNPPAVASLTLSPAMNTAIRTDVLKSMKPEWNKLDILARLCHSVLVHCQDASVTAYLSSASNPASGTVTAHNESALDLKSESLHAEPTPQENETKPTVASLLNESVASSSTSSAPSDVSNMSPRTEAAHRELDDFVEVCLESAAKSASKRPWEHDDSPSSDFMSLHQAKRIALEG
jgi:hypothetical protein